MSNHASESDPTAIGVGLGGTKIEVVFVHLRGIVSAFNPSRLILGGGVVEGYPKLIELVQEGVRQQTPGAATESLEVSKAKLGGDAGVVGAAALALTSFSSRHPDGQSRSKRGR